ncbi:uncharacterized protein BT62DRAFT_1071297 [Guyanagaster necrorhizus]|uniref:Uncharacterized protein n=1 Tax=Guyanagaster necrorhizus TaxID=856835 RepID=A0A9P8AY60_9AGAR|nr:uncharacterized protein BT62DRAFT_1071297 [Guyanagaster necrorhizus MCA 3950]KAG7452120.1 hypothetical protein BT62DRAFT_1071297 [Guyanagaster necrorhizus MCA 3950]
MQAKPDIPLGTLRITNNSSQMGGFCTVQPTASKKRKRTSQQNELPDAEAILPDGADDSTKSRRVNPHHLAARLGPDLVREMEVHIKPGAYMPSFPIRKDLQERYNVDRRHLYDYFHSRGLRVAKEERFNNLTRSRMQKAQLAASVAETDNSASTRPAKTNRKRRAKAKRTILAPITTNATVSAPNVNANADSGGAQKCSDSPGRPLKESGLPNSPTSTPRINASPLRSLDIADVYTPRPDTPYNPSDEPEPSSVRCENFSSSALSYPSETFDSSLPPRERSFPPAALSYPKLSEPSTAAPSLNSSLEISPASCGTLDNSGTLIPAPDECFSPFDPVIEMDTTDYLALFDYDNFCPQSACDESSQLMPPEGQILEPEQKAHLYELINRAAKFSDQAQQSLGTYKAYMELRRRVYYDALSPGDELHCKEQSEGAASSVDLFNFTEVDVGNWIHAVFIDEPFRVSASPHPSTAYGRPLPGFAPRLSIPDVMASSACIPFNTFTKQALPGYISWPGSISETERRHESALHGRFVRPDVFSVGSGYRSRPMRARSMSTGGGI